MVLSRRGAGPGGRATLPEGGSRGATPPRWPRPDTPPRGKGRPCRRWSGTPTTSIHGQAYLRRTWRLGLPPAAGVASTAVRWLSSRSTQFVEASTPWSIGAAGKEKDHLSVVGEGEKSKTTRTAAGPVFESVSLRSFQYAMWFLSLLAASGARLPAEHDPSLSDLGAGARWET